MEDAIVNDKAKAAFVITDDDKKLYEMNKEYYKAIPLEEVEGKFGHCKIYRIQNGNWLH